MLYPGEVRQPVHRVPRDAARALPEERQKLHGYELGNYALGFVDGMQSPMTLLR